MVSWDSKSAGTMNAPNSRPPVYRVAAMRWLLLVFMIAACGRLEPIALRGAPSIDAGVVVDAGHALDAGVSPRDAGPEIDPEATLVGDALACHLTPEEQVEAAIRVAACDERGVRATAISYIEAFDAGLFGTFVPYLEGLAGFEMRQGCAFWRCAATADSCDALAGCRTPLPGRCADDEFETRCLGTQLARCEFGELRRVIDCADFDAACVNGACERDGCRFGDFGADSQEPSCSEDRTKLVVCPGVFEMECEAFRPGSSCAPFYVTGEVPVSWCSPTGEGIAGAYEREGQCVGSTFRYDPVSRPAGEFECRPDYRVCTRRGCAP